MKMIETLIKNKVAKASFIVALLFAFSPIIALAATPSLSLSNISNDSVRVNVSGDAHTSATLYFHANNASGYSSSALGTTDSNGNLTTTLNSSSYGIQSGSSVYVVVNGQQSPLINWPYGGGSNSAIYFSQNRLTLDKYNDQVVTIYGGSNASYTVHSNSNTQVVSTSLVGDKLTLSGDKTGESTIVICSSDTSSNCGTINVSVVGINFNLPPVVLSQNTVNVGVGQTVSVGVMGGLNVFYVSSNYDNDVAYVTINKNSVNVTGHGFGRDTVIICSTHSSGANETDYNSCATLFINVGPMYANNNTSNSNSLLGTSISGVFLSDIPYTGVAENLKMALFFIGMFMWSLFMAYVLYVKKHGVNPFEQLMHSSVTSAGSQMKSRIEQFKKENLSRRS